jgi:hypothetical protein
MLIMQLPAWTRSDTACKRLCSTLFNQTSQDFLSTKIFIYITVFTVTTVQGKYEVIENITKYSMITLLVLDLKLVMRSCWISVPWHLG